MTLPLLITAWCLALIFAALAGTVLYHALDAVAGELRRKWKEYADERDDRIIRRRDEALRSLKEFLADRSPKDRNAMAVFSRLLDQAGGTLRIQQQDFDADPPGQLVISVDDETSDLVFTRLPPSA